MDKDATMDLYADDDLGLDDVEYFKEFLKFKKSRALVKAQMALKSERTPFESIESGSNPPPPGTDGSYNPPPPFINVKSEEKSAPSAQSANSVFHGTREAENEDQEIESEKGEEILGKETSGEIEVDRGADRDRSERNRSPRFRRFHSRSRERDSWRPQRRSRSRSPHGERSIRNSRDARDLRETRDHRDFRDSRNGRDPRDYRDSRNGRDFRDQRGRPPDHRSRYDSRMAPRPPHLSRSRSREPNRSYLHHSEDAQKYGLAQPGTERGQVPLAQGHIAAQQQPHDSHATSHWGQAVPPAAARTWDHNVISVPIEESPEEKARKLAIEKEALHQKQTFISQQMEYLKKREVLITELGLLRNQRREIGSNKTPDAQKFVSENLKLQDELMTKIKSVENVLDMLKGLIGDTHEDHSASQDALQESSKDSDKEKKKSKKRKRSRSSSSSSNDSNDRSERGSRSRKREVECQRSDDEALEVHKQRGGELIAENPVRSETSERYNLVFYDPEVHWCRACNAFPSTAKEYLLHLHSQEHKDTTQDRKLNDLPWHEMSEHQELVTIDGLQTKRCPIKGLQFFEASTAWFCKLCHSWMGDLHCASLHLKSKEHNNEFERFASTNPKWEASWLSDRGKAVVSSGKKEDILKRQLEEQLLLQKKHEEELKLTLEATSKLVMPLTLQNKPAPKLSKEKSKKKSKDKKKSKKKKKRQSSDSSSVSSSTSSSSSSDEASPTKGKNKGKKSKSKGNKKDSEVIKAAVPEKSKWEKEESEDEQMRRARTPELDPHPILEARKVRNYRWLDQHLDREKPARFIRPSSPTRTVPEKHTILIPESNKAAPALPLPTKAPQPAPAQNFSQPSRSRERGREVQEQNEDGESRFDRQAQEAARKKQQPAVLPKTKFAFIGRMPFAKRRLEPSQEKPSKEQDVATPDPTPPPPPMISQKVVSVKAPPPVLTAKTKLVVAKEILNKSQTVLQQRQLHQGSPVSRPMDPVLMEEDMDIDKINRSPPNIQLPPSPPKIRPVLPPEVTTNLGKKRMAVPLPKDFQEALSIIYPELPKAKTPPPPAPPSARIPSPPRIEPPPRVPTPPPPLPPDLNPMTIPMAPSPPPLPRAPPSPPLPADDYRIIPKSRYDDYDEMALLGIDKEDMAASSFRFF